MKVILKMINMNEKEYIIIIMVIDMKEIYDLREGKGIFYINNGNRYEGDWKNDKY